MRIGLAVILVGLLVPTARAQHITTPPPATPYGGPIDLATAKRLMAAAEAEATRNRWTMAIVILDSTGHPVMMEKIDDTQYGSITAAEDKAHSALDFKRPTKAFEDLVAQGGVGLRTLSLRGASALEGGLPIIRDGRIIGAVGVSGGSSAQDGQVAKAAADAK